MRLKNDKDLKRIAYHEAGHVIVGYVLQRECEAVEIDLEEENDIFGFAKVDNSFCYDYYYSKDKQKAMRLDCVVLCGGLAAETVFINLNLDIDDSFAWGDIDQIIDLERYGLKIKKGGYIGDESTWRFISRCTEKARNILRCNRKAVQDLASILIGKKKLGKDELNIILKDLIKR